MGEVNTMAALFILVSLSFASVLGKSPVVHDVWDVNMTLVAQRFQPDCVEPTPSCPQNEEYRCRNSCPPETCITLYAAISCVQNQTCNQGCFCKKGFLRTTTNGTCVLRDQCLPLECVNDPNAQRGCGDRCGRTCADYNDKRKICKKGPCKLNGCDCKPGYIYDKNVNKCVKPNECTKQCTKPNERYSECLLSECVPKTCKDLGKPLPCPDIAAPCAGGCICEAGYVRDCNGNCVDAKTCASCGGDPNAQSGCGNSCGKTCASLNINLTNLVCPQYCEENGCDCKDGYLLNTDTKKCTLIKDCPKPPNQCGKNEEYYCGSSCPEASCDNPNPPICVNKKCELKCYCKKGFVRDANKKCVSVNTCPATCTKPHERYIDCLAGQCTPKTCDDLGRSIPCPFIVGPCPGGCICEEGYLRNAEGICIKIEQCPPKPCGVNQTWTSPCNSPCNNQLCPRNDKESPPCEPIEPCYPGCQCKLNYRLNSTRQCILAPDCPPINCTRQNEVFDSCPSACLAENCEDVNNQPKTCNTLIWLCSPRCVCKKGHFRNKDGLCVPAAQCPSKCTKPNEKFIDCLEGQCEPKTCKELQVPAPCIRVKPPCPGGCICIDGFVRDDTGACIKKENCPIICNGPNEQNSTCANKQCTPTTCKEVVKMPYCPLPNPGPCTTGCVCKRGFVRSSNGTCVAIKDCPEAGNCASKNETWVQCAANCGPAYCPKDDQPQPNCFLPVGACQPGCHCKPNYRINKDNQCILASECPAVPCTRPNEIFSSCPSNRIMTSAAIGTTPVPNNGPEICNPGCICKTGFHKNDNGTCVPKSGYPTTCTKPHERYIDCLSGICAPKTCDDLGRPIPCPFIGGPCPGGCICEEGYLRNADGMCIKIEHCPPKPCEANQTWTSPCNSPCNNQLCPRNDKESPPCEPIKPCYPGCQCKLNYRLNSTRQCILAPDCPPINCTRQNEVFDSCPSACLAENCEDVNNQPKTCNTLIWLCSPRCVCKKGHFRNKDGLCVPAAQCPSKCTKPNEKFIDCLEGQCEPKTCKELQVPAPCIRVKPPCPGGCICIDGFVRDDTGACIKKENCRKFVCGILELKLKERRPANKRWSSFL